jgi:hypothetical protein
MRHRSRHRRRGGRRIAFLSSLSYLTPNFRNHDFVNPLPSARLRRREIIPIGTVLLLFILGGCDEGLSPVSASSPASRHGISGAIYFRNWPPRDSVLDLRLAAFKGLPSSDLVSDIQQGRARFTDMLSPYGADSIPYRLLLAPLSPGRFSYIGVAQQFGPNIQRDWRLVGVYHAGGDTTSPGFIDVPADSVVPGVNITVDFLHPPPQPS